MLKKQQQVPLSPTTKTETSQNETQQFSQILTPQEVNPLLFSQACELEQPQQLFQFIESVTKILKLYEKPGRDNPLLKLQSGELKVMIDKLKALKARLEHTVYQFRVASILGTFEQIFQRGSTVRDKSKGRLSKKISTNLKVEEVMENFKILNGKFSTPSELYQYSIECVLPAMLRQILSINDHKKRYQQVLKTLQFCNLLIHPTQLEVQISKNTLLQTRTFKMKYQQQFQYSQTIFLQQVANIVNEAILCPSDCLIQGMLLRLLKRMYRIWGQSVHGPVYLNLRNISLFYTENQQTSKIIKQAAIFCYQVIHSKLDIKLCDMLSSSQDLKSLKSNQFFSSKGLTLPFEYNSCLDTNNLQLPIWDYKLHLQKRQTYVHVLYVHKSSTMLYWSFKIIDFDIGFGVYKVKKLKRYEIEQYNNNPECKPIIKMAKNGQNAQNSKSTTQGHIFLKQGLYHLVFDNSHSMMRGKDLLVKVCQLQPIS